MPDEESLSACTTLGIDSDVEKPRDGKTAAPSASSPQGYERIAEMLAIHPTNAVFRQFGSLNALNLLHYQAELTQLEEDLCEAAKLDRNDTDRCRQLYFRSHWLLSHGSTHDGEPTAESMAQWKLILKMRRVMKEYNEAIIAQHTIRKIARPNKGLIGYLQHWTLDNGNNEHVLLLDKDSEVWEKTPRCDLVALHAAEYEDAISTWITNKALLWYHRVLGHRSAKRVFSGTFMASTSIYDRRPLLKIVTVIAIGIASLMPILSIVLLNAIHDDNARLGVMALFTFVFCAFFGIFTGPKKTELLAASAAFAAVQVVFITGDNGCKQS